jgi:Cytoskeletal-regulatory complex EF hand
MERFKLFAKHSAIKQHKMEFNEQNFQSRIPLLEFKEQQYESIKKTCAVVAQVQNNTHKSKEDLAYEHYNLLMEQLPAEAYDVKGNIKPEYQKTINDAMEQYNM